MSLKWLPSEHLFVDLPWCVQKNGVDAKGYTLFGEGKPGRDMPT